MRQHWIHTAEVLTTKAKEKPPEKLKAWEKAWAECKPKPALDNGERLVHFMRLHLIRSAAAGREMLGRPWTLPELAAQAFLRMGIHVSVPQALLLC